MSEPLREALARLPELFAAHVMVTGVALLVGIVLGLPLAVAARRRPLLRSGAIGLAGVVQTIPSLALLALMVPLLGAFGLLPALVALVLYSVLPILRNTLVGLEGIPRELLDAGSAVGMTPTQRLRLVELPLAAPVIMAGVRTAAIWVVGTATLTTPVGQPSLGNLIFGGLQTRSWATVLVGCAAAAVLALVLDALIALWERAAARRDRRQGALALVGVALLFVGGSSLPSSRPDAPANAVSMATATSDVPADAKDRAALERVVVGAKTFTEQYILAALLEARLREAGLQVARADSLGSSVVFDALRTGRLDVYVDYSGTLWANVLKRNDVRPAWEMAHEVAAHLAREHDIRVLGALGFENAYALSMRRDRAEALGVRSIADLAAHAPRLRLGSDYEFLQRPEWARVRDAYGLAFKDLVSFDSTFMYDAVHKGDVDVISAFSSDGRIAAYDLVVLEDPLPAFPAYDAIVLLGPRAANDRRVVGALAPLVGTIRVERMRAANLMVDRDDDKRTPRQAAGWLLEPAP
ncbi:MAG: ABC transporter permease/substrate-binding protein [Deltaproteobacteria bacterium]|nr:ABC transporter permease/substrate-binding protein [Deltaproteobacteria bacterium]